MMDSLPQFGLPHPGFATELEFVRALEEYEGPILTEYAGEWGTRYVEKWCTQTPDGRVFRSLLVRSDLRSIELYLLGKIDLRKLLEERSDGFGFLVDQTLDDAQPTMSLVTLSSLPPNYLGAPGTFHDPTLRPWQQRTRQLFLLEDSWSGDEIGRTERIYLDAAAFNEFAARVEGPTPAPIFPESALSYLFRGGFVVAQMFAECRKQLEPHIRGRTVYVHASSPGILAIEVEARTAENLRSSLSALDDTMPFYRQVQEWARQDVQGTIELPPTAARDLQLLASSLNLDLVRFRRAPTVERSAHMLTLGKLLTSYHRKLQELARLENIVLPGRE